MLIGVEHEYRILDGDRQVDFRGLIHGYGLGVRHLDPGDPNAYRLETGAALTCDEAEAEVALPPVPLRPGFTDEVVARAEYERQRLENLVAPFRVEGYSTHISVSTPRAIGDGVALLFTRTFAPGLMLLMDRPTSPGMLVRPRLGRTELGGEYVEGDALRIAATFAAAAVLQCSAALRRSRPVSVPPSVSTRVQRDDRRFGWFVDRYALGRGSPPQWP